MHKSKDEIVTELRSSFQQLDKVGNAVSRESFNISKEGKWTAAENIRHLVTGTKITSMAFNLPKFVHIILYGRHKHPSHTYTKVVDNYHKKLDQGAKAFGVYVPKKIDYNQQELTLRLAAEGNKLIEAINKKWSETQLDHYRVKHPILGLLTMRELAYFTIYHNAHHLATIEKYYLS